MREPTTRGGLDQPGGVTDALWKDANSRRRNLAPTLLSESRIAFEEVPDGRRCCCAT
jgi:hypothetical protein